MTNILMIIPPERFRDEELFVTKEELENSGNNVSIASTKKGVILGSRGGTVNAELLLADINIKEYDAVVFVGGAGSELLFDDIDALSIAKTMYDDKKIVSAICLAPVILANAGILKGKKATVTGTEANTIEAKGAEYTEPGVTVDGRIVTADGPEAAQLFAQAIDKLLKR